MYHNVLSSDLSGCMHVNQTLNIFNPDYGLFSMMQRAGYRTGGFGKVINGQKHQFCVPDDKLLVTGFDWLSVPCDEGDYFSPVAARREPLTHSSIFDPRRFPLDPLGAPFPLLT